MRIWLAIPMALWMILAIGLPVGTALAQAEDAEVTPTQRGGFARPEAEIEVEAIGDREDLMAPAEVGDKVGGKKDLLMAPGKVGDKVGGKKDLLMAPGKVGDKVGGKKDLLMAPGKVGDKVGGKKDLMLPESGLEDGRGMPNEPTPPGPR